VERAQDLLAEIGLERERVEMFNMSAAMAVEFVAAANEMTERIAELGPNPLRADGNEGEGSVSG
jgi:coenzyme F420-reducing hydrogenase delta subunit